MLEKPLMKFSIAPQSMLNVLEKPVIQGTYLNIIKAIYRKLIAYFKLNGKKQSISTKIRNKTSLPTPYLFSILLKVLARQ